MALGTSTNCQLRVFSSFKKEKSIANEVSVLARLAFCGNLLIGQETIVRCPHQQVSVLSGLNLEKM